MTTYIPMQSALYALESAYLVSTVLLIAISGMAIAAIASLEKTDEDTKLFRWFS